MSYSRKQLEDAGVPEVFIKKIHDASERAKYHRILNAISDRLTDEAMMLKTVQEFWALKRTQETPEVERTPTEDMSDQQ